MEDSEVFSFLDRVFFFLSFFFDDKLIVRRAQFSSFERSDLCS